METLLLVVLGMVALAVLGLALAYQLCRLVGVILFELFCRHPPARAVVPRRPVAPLVPAVVLRRPVLVVGDDLRQMAGGLADLNRVAADERGRRCRPVLVVGDDLRQMAGGLADLTRVAADERGRRRRRRPTR